MFQNLSGSLLPPPPPPRAPPPLSFEQPARRVGPAIAAALSPRNERRDKPDLPTISGPLCSNVVVGRAHCCSRVEIITTSATAALAGCLVDRRMTACARANENGRPGS